MQAMLHTLFHMYEYVNQLCFRCVVYLYFFALIIRFLTTLLFSNSNSTTTAVSVSLQNFLWFSLPLSTTNCAR